MFLAKIFTVGGVLCYLELPNRVRLGKHMEKDIISLEKWSNSSEAADYPAEELHVFGHNERVNQFSDRRLATQSRIPIRLVATVGTSVKE